MVSGTSIFGDPGTLQAPARVFEQRCIICMDVQKLGGNGIPREGVDVREVAPEEALGRCEREAGRCDGNRSKWYKKAFQKGMGGLQFPTKEEVENAKEILQNWILYE